MESYYATSLRAGQLPLWNPYIFGGVPFLANSQAGVYYPLNLAFLLGSIPNVYSVELAAHSLIAAGGMLWFGRRFVGLSWFGAVVAGLAFGFGGAIVTMAGHLNQIQVAAWLPWMLGAGHQVVIRPGSRPLVFLAILITLQALAGHTQQLYIGLWALAVYSVWTYLRQVHVGPFRLANRALWYRLAALAGAGVLAAGLSAAQMVPTLELASLSIRAGGLSYWEATAFSLPPFELAAALVPPVAGGAPFSEFVGYVGVVGLALAICGLAARFGSRERFWLGWSIVALLLAFGHFTALYYVLYELVPGFDVFRAPARWLVLFAFGASVLARLGRRSRGQTGTSEARSRRCGDRRCCRNRSGRRPRPAGRNQAGRNSGRLVVGGGHRPGIRPSPGPVAGPPPIITPDPAPRRGALGRRSTAGLSPSDSGRRFRPDARQHRPCIGRRFPVSSSFHRREHL